MTQKEKKQLKRNIEALLKRSYVDDGNSYELEFREMLEIIANEWDEIITSPKLEEKKHKLTVIYGKEACDYWDYSWENGLDNIRNAIKNDEVYGGIETYEFETERDRELAKIILADADGWETNAWDER